MAKKTSKPPAQNGREFWKHHIREWQRGDLRQSEYCRKNGLDQQQFSSWKSKIIREGMEEPPVQFVELPSGPAPRSGGRPLFEFRLDEDLRVSLIFSMTPEFMRDMFGGGR